MSQQFFLSIFHQFVHQFFHYFLINVLKVWDIKTGVEELELTFNSEKFKISAICHPSTYLDKVTGDRI